MDELGTRRKLHQTRISAFDGVRPIYDALHKNRDDFWNSTEGESDRGLVLVALAYVENKLDHCLYEYFSDEALAKELLAPSGPLGAMSAKLKLCVCLNILQKDTSSLIGTLAKIRNQFAHDFEASFDKSPSRELALSLLDDPMLTKEICSPKKCFEVAVLALDDHIWPRPQEVSLFVGKLPDVIPTYTSSPD